MDLIGGDANRKVYTQSQISGIKALFDAVAAVHVQAPSGQETFASVTVSHDRGGCRIEERADADGDTSLLNIGAAIASLPPPT